VLPSDRAVSRAVNLGTTVADSEPRAKVSRAVSAVVADLAEELGFGRVEDPAATSYDVTSTRLFGRLWRRLIPGGTS
jgi:hypothetical protein